MKIDLKINTFQLLCITFALTIDVFIYKVKYILGVYKKYAK